MTARKPAGAKALASSQHQRDLADAVRLVVESGVSPGAAARELNVSVDAVLRAVPAARAALNAAAQPALASPGGWIDERVPDLRKLLAPHGIDAGTFSAWLGPLLGTYRWWLAENAKRPARSDQRDSLRQLAKDLAAVQTHLGSGRIPPQAAAHLQLVLFKSGESSWHEIADRMRNDLVVLEFAAQQVASMLERQPAKRGRKASTARDTLLKLVIERVRKHGKKGMRADKVRALASEVLETCHVDMPKSGDDETIKKAAGRGRRTGE